MKWYKLCVFVYIIDKKMGVSCDKEDRIVFKISLKTVALMGVACNKEDRIVFKG